jgi:hypothetical protein
MTPLPPYRRRAIGLSKDCMAVLEDLRAHEPRRPYDRAKAAERLGWASRKVGTVLRKLVELGRIRPLPKQVREMTDKHPIWESLRYEILD